MPRNSFQWGNFHWRFVTSGASHQLAEVIEVFQFCVSDDESVAAHTVDITRHADEHSYPDVERIFKSVFEDFSKSHTAMVYLHGSVLENSAGELVLLAGLSFAGKTTTSAAAVASGKFKVYAEDLTYFSDDGLPVPLPFPLRLRTGAPLLINEAVGCGLAASDLWLCAPKFYTQNKTPRAIKQAVLLLPGDAQNAELAVISAQAFIRPLLPLTNAIRLDNGIETLNRALSGADCISVKGGTVAQRLALLR